MQIRIEQNQNHIHKQLFLLISACLCLLSALIYSPTTTLAQTTNAKSLILSDNYKEHFLSPYLTKYSDPEHTLTAEQIIAPLFLKGEPLQSSGSITALDTEGHPIWLTFSIMNRSTKTGWKLDFGSSLMGRFGLFDEIRSYTYNKETQKLVENTQHKDGSILANIPINQRSQIIIKLETAKGIPITIPLRLLRQDQKSTTIISKTLFISMILLIGMAFFFAAVALLKSAYGYLYFSAYYLSLTLILLIQNDFITAESFFLIGSELIPLLFFATAVCSFMIARLFWNMDIISSRLAHISFLCVIGLGILCFLSAWVLPIPSAIIKSALFFGPSLFIIVLIPLISIVKSQQGNDEATPFMFAWFILLFGLCITILALSGIMQPVSTAINAYWYTLIPQALFFAFATKMKLLSETADVTLSRTLEIHETDSVSRLRQSKENTEQKRLLKVIENERKVLGELRKSEARQTDEMRNAKETADNANKAKSAFLAVVSHEIRTPMTGVMGMVRLLLDSNLTKEQKEYAQTIQDSSDAMLALLNDILDFEKIEQSKMVFENIDFDLHRLINGVARLMNGHATQKEIDLKVKIGDDLPRHVKGDQTRLRQILLNLTGNAVKFTNEGHVTITAELIKNHEDTETYDIYFSIKDSGIGIPKSAQEDLFAPFSQADTSISRKFGGTGLGLAISKGLVQGMGSNININSNEGEGSTFFFTLNMPAGRNKESSSTRNASQTKPQSETKPMHILVVDDNHINQKVIKGFLEKLPYTLEMADDAETALKKVEEHKFDLILMDIELPGMRGDEAARKLRSSPQEHIKNIPIFALTGNLMPQDIEKFYDAGMNGVIAKPIDLDKLTSTIKKSGQRVFDNPSMNVKKEKLKIKNDEIKISQPPLQVKETSPALKPISIQNTDTVETGAPVAKTFDPATLETLKGHLSTKDIQDMVNDVFIKTDEIVASMNEALKNEDQKMLHANGHELKGMAGNFGLMEISEQAGKIEHKARTEPNIVLTTLISAFPEMQKRAKEALDHWINNA